MYVGPDASGQQGIFLYKELPTEAGLALEKCLKAVTPQILTWGQYAEAAIAIARRRWYGKDAVAPYVPDFTKCCDHFCLHAGARLGLAHSAQSSPVQCACGAACMSHAALAHNQPR